MTWSRLMAGSLLAAAAGWWALGPTAMALDKAVAFERPQVRARAIDPNAILLARLDMLQSFSLFPAADASDTSTPEASQLRLQGTSESPGRRAVLISVGGATPQWVAAGKPAGGLELVELHPTRATVRTAAGETVTLELFSPTRDAPATPASREPHEPS